MKTLNSGVNEEFAPFVSIVIPTFNEGKVISKRIENLDALEYPSNQMEVIFVDGASTDGTAELIERLSKSRPYLHLVRQTSRQGYNAAIYEGIRQAKSDIVITGEGGSFFHPRAISSVVRHLAESSVGVVAGKSVLYNPKETWVTRLEEAYRNAHDSIRFAESKVDSTPDMKGELLAFRKEIGLLLMAGGILAPYAFFDMSISYFARAKGLRAIFEPEAIFYEYAPTTIRERMIVQVRRGTSFTGSLWSFRYMILNPKFGYFGTLIVPSRFLFLIAFPWMLLCAPFVLFWESLSQPLLGAAVLALVLVFLLHGRTRYALISFALSQVAAVAVGLRLLLGRYSQMINTVPTTRR